MFMMFNVLVFSAFIYYLLLTCFLLLLLFVVF